MDPEERIARWLKRSWKVSQETGALWINTCGYNVAVMEEFGKPGVWKYRIKPEPRDSAATWSTDTYFSEESAKRAVLKKLLDMLS